MTVRTANIMETHVLMEKRSSIKHWVCCGERHVDWWLVWVCQSAVKWLWLFVWHPSRGNRISWDDALHADLTSFEQCQQGRSLSQTLSTWYLICSLTIEFLSYQTHAEPQPAHPPLRNNSTILSLDTFRFCQSHFFFFILLFALSEASIICLLQIQA